MKNRTYKLYKVVQKIFWKYGGDDRIRTYPAVLLRHLSPSAGLHPHRKRGMRAVRFELTILNPIMVRSTRSVLVIIYHLWHMSVCLFRHTRICMTHIFSARDLHRVSQAVSWIYIAFSSATLPTGDLPAHTCRCKFFKSSRVILDTWL